jgi:hypothetical protein
MSTINIESYLTQLVGRMVRIAQVQGDDLYLNVLSLNATGVLVQDDDYEYFIPWASIINLRLATDSERQRMGSPEFRRRIEHPVLDLERNKPQG